MRTRQLGSPCSSVSCRSVCCSKIQCHLSCERASSKWTFIELGASEGCSQRRLTRRRHPHRLLPQRPSRQAWPAENGLSASARTCPWTPWLAAEWKQEAPQAPSGLPLAVGLAWMRPEGRWRRWQTAARESLSSHCRQPQGQHHGLVGEMESQPQRCWDASPPHATTPGRWETRVRPLGGDDRMQEAREGTLPLGRCCPRTGPHDAAWAWVHCFETRKIGDGRRHKALWLLPRQPNGVAHCRWGQTTTAQKVAQLHSTQHLEGHHQNLHHG